MRTIWRGRALDIAFGRGLDYNRRAGNVLEVSGAVSSTAFAAAVTAMPAGPLTVRPTPGQASFSVTGDDHVFITRQNVTFEHGVFPDIGYFGADSGITTAGSGFIFDHCTLHSIYVDGADDWIIRDCEMPFNGASLAGDMQGGSILANCQNWQILRTNISGFYFNDPPDGHFEAINIRTGAQHGLIKDCAFDNGGNTAAIFFTWYDNQANTATWPRDICVTGCSFTNIFNTNAAIDVVGLEYPVDSNPYNLKFDPNCTHDGSTANLSTRGLYEVACSTVL